MKWCLHFLQNNVSQSRAEAMAETNEITDFIKNYEEEKDRIPANRGIYIFVAKKTKFTYPWGESPVIYIGTSNNLRRRISRHYAKTLEAKETGNTRWNYSRYNYIVKFHADLYFMRVKGTENEKDLESKVIEDFYDRYGALPVGNGAFSFKKEK